MKFLDPLKAKIMKQIKTKLNKKLKIKQVKYNNKKLSILALKTRMKLN